MYSHYIPFMDTQTMQNALRYVQNTDLNVVLPQPDRDHLIVAYVLHALVLKSIGRAQESQLFIEKCRQALYPFFDQSFGSYSTSYAYVLLALYYVTDNDRIRSKFYVNAVEGYLNNAEKNSNRTPLQLIHDQFLQQVHTMVVSMSCMCPLCTALNISLRSLVRSAVLLQQNKAIQEGKTFQITDQVISKIFEEKDAPIDYAVASHIASICDTLFTEVSAPSGVNILRESLRLLCHGVMLKSLQRIGADKYKIQSVAHDISLLSAKPYFASLLPVSSMSVVLAAMVQLKYSNEDPDAMNLLKEQVHSLRTISNRYLIISSRYGSLIEQLANHTQGKAKINFQGLPSCRNNDGIHHDHDNHSHDEEHQPDTPGNADWDDMLRELWAEDTTLELFADDL